MLGLELEFKTNGHNAEQKLFVEFFDIAYNILIILIDDRYIMLVW